MKTYEHHLWITDLDGTIIPRGETISAENRAAIHAFVDGGGQFAVATGRTPASSLEYIRDLPINAPCVFFNGAMLYDWANQRPLAIRPLPARDGEPNVWADFARHCQALLPTACIEVYTAENCHIITDAAYDDPRLADEYCDYVHTPLAALSDMSATPWLKFFVCAAPDELLKLEHAAKEWHMDALSHSFYSEANYYEFVAKHASKGAMLDEIKRLPAYQDHYTIASGDFLNDREMIEVADLGIAPKNAHPDVQQAADRVGVDVSGHLIAWGLAELDFPLTGV